MLKNPIFWIVVLLLLVAAAVVYGVNWYVDSNPPASGFEVQELEIQGSLTRYFVSRAKLDNTFIVVLPPDPGIKATPVGTATVAAPPPVPSEWVVYNPGNACTCFKLNEKNHPVDSLPCTDGSKLAAGTHIGVCCSVENSLFYFTQR